MKKLMTDEEITAKCIEAKEEADNETAEKQKAEAEGKVIAFYETHNKKAAILREFRDLAIKNARERIPKSFTVFSNPKRVGFLLYIHYGDIRVGVKTKSYYLFLDGTIYVTSGENDLGPILVRTVDIEHWPIDTSKSQFCQEDVNDLYWYFRNSTVPYDFMKRNEANKLHSKMLLV